MNAGVRKSAADMVRSMLVILAAVALLVFLVPRPSAVPRPAVDLASAADGAQRRLGFEVLTPIPAGWTVTSARVREDTGNIPSWTVNYLTDDDRYVGLVQAAGWSAGWQSSLTHGGTAQPPVQAGGRSWEHYYKPERSLTSLLARQGAGRPGEISTLILARGGGLDDATRLAEALPAATPETSPSPSS